jgi:lipopolysaccharide/colanic/teichoic acid biosynthesis glycosyltransferase
MRRFSDLTTEPARRAQESKGSESGPFAQPALPASYFGWKDSVGRVFALALLIIGSPIMLLTILLVRLTSPGPAIYRQTRVGRGGRSFVMYKIRSMRIDAEAKTGPVWTAQRDPRITRVGQFIRKVHLDEFPQLINVVKGEMALIGPRPERPEFVQMLAIEIPGYMDRHQIRPGITGLAQINLPPDTDLQSVRRKLVVDLHYVKNGSLLMDVRIFGCTFCRMIGLPGQLSARLWGLDCRPQLREAAGSLLPVSVSEMVAPSAITS